MMRPFDPKNFIPKLSMIILAGLFVMALWLHYYRLDQIPYGYHVDEMSGSVTIGCLSTEGVDAHHVAYPLFSDLNYGTPKPPTYLYPAIIWAKFFGFTVPSLRALSVSVHLIGIIGLFLLAQSLFGWRYAIITAVLASLSPWSWVLSRVAFESLFSVTFMIWGLYFLFHSPRVWRMCLAGIFLAAAMYSYPPIRFQVPLMLIPLVFFCRKKYQIKWKNVVLLGLVLTVILIPLAQNTLNGKLQKRFNQISIFSNDYLKSINASHDWLSLSKIFLNVYAFHFHSDFLFFKGDPSYVHSTRHFGILSWMDILALGIGIFFLLMFFFKKKKANNPLYIHREWVIFLLISMMIGVIPSALTNSEIPNSLRIMGSWPYLSLLSGFLLWQACEQCWGMWLIVVLTTAIFAFSFLRVYFFVYPDESKGMFGYWTLEEASQLKTDEDWLKFLLLYRHDDYHARYFLIHYRGISCSQSEKIWDNLRDYLISQGKYY